ncbi:MAG: hypothetical protein P9L91_02895 [Candidatus Zophobacter franzmannii]|nr:hypothetical protein [Candidatus Zophobacter franzmannii]
MNAPFSTEAISTFIQSLGIMGKGMLGIFVFMGLFYGIIKLLNRFTKKDGKKD